MNTFVLLVTLATLYSADALKCRTCLFMEGSSDHEVMKMLLVAMSKESMSECVNSAESAPEVTCEGLEMEPDTDSWMCGKGDVKTPLTLDNPEGSSMRADMHIVSRGCGSVKSTDEKAKDGCYPASQFKEMIKTKFGSKEGMPTMGKLSGEFCVCPGDNCNSAAGQSALVLLVLTMLSIVFFV